MTTNSTDRFEDRLLAQLQDVVAANPAPAAATPATARSRAPRIALATAGTAAAAVAVVLVATGGGDGSTAKAYDVSKGGDDAVSVTIRSLDDAAGLQKSLNDAGVPAVVCATAPAHAKPPANGATGAHRTRGAEAGAGVEGAGESGTAKKGGTTSGGDRPSPVAVNAMPLSVHTKADGSLTFTVHRGDLPSGEHLYITTQGDPDVGPVSVGFGVGPGCDG